jgi:hypothetical protein
MHEALLELVMISNMVDVYMCGNGCHRSVEDVLRELAETCNAKSSINHQVAIASAHMPDVTAQNWYDMRFEDKRDVVIYTTTLKPSFSDLEHRPSASAVSERTSNR